VNFQAGMQQQPGILQPAEADSQSIGRRRFTESSGSMQGACIAGIRGRPRAGMAHGARFFSFQASDLVPRTFCNLQF
jgi:hypothetical protein